MSTMQEIQAINSELNKISAPVKKNSLVELINSMEINEEARKIFFDALKVEAKKEEQKPNPTIDIDNLVNRLHVAYVILSADE